MKRLAQMKAVLGDAVDVVVRFYGEKKNGWAQKIRIQAHFKKRVVRVEKFLSRPIGDFYDTIRNAMSVFGSELKEKVVGKKKAMRRDRTLSAKYSPAM